MTQTAINYPNGGSMAESRVESVLQATWPLPIWLTIVIGVAALGLIGGLYFSERGTAGRSLRLLLVLLRFTLFALVLWMWAGWSWLQFRSDKPELLIVLDRSASMDTRDASPASGGAGMSSGLSDSRLKMAKRLLTSIKPRDRERLDRDYQVRWLLVDEGVNKASFSLSTIASDLEQIVASGTQSRLGDSLSSIVSSQAGRGTAAIVFFSDGINTNGVPLATAATQARSAGIPIYSIAMGQELALPDARLTDLLLDEAVFLGDQVTLLVTVSISDVAEANLSVRLKAANTGEVLDQQPLTLTKQLNQQQLSLSFVPTQAGEMVLQIDVSDISGETNLENNLLQRSIQVQDKTLRVLLVQKQPSFEFRFLKNLLQRSQATDSRSASFDLSSVLQDSDIAYVEQDATAIRLVPNDIETLSSYDVFVFGDISPELISRSAQRLIYEQVTARGSGCMFIAGRDTQLAALSGWPLGDLLPVQFDGQDSKVALAGSNETETTPYYWSPTTLGSSAMPLQLAENSETTASLWTSIPPTLSLFSAFSPKLGSQVLAVASPQPALGVAKVATQPRDSQQFPPLLVSQFAGAGRVALQATDETYRWTSFGGSDRFHQRYWEQMLRWLSRGRLSGDAQQSRLVIEPQRSKFSQPVRFELQLGKESDAKAGNGNAELTLEDSSGKKSTLLLPRDVGATRTFSTTKSDLPPGSYRAVVFQPSLQPPPSDDFTVVTPPGEQTNLKADWNALRDLALQSRGRFYVAADGLPVFENLPAGKPARLGTLPPRPLWNSPWVAALFVVLLTSEWLLRRQARML